MTPRALAQLLYYSSLIFVGMGIILRSRELIGAGCFGAGVGYALRDYFSKGVDSVSVMSCYAAFAGLWFGLGNLAGYLADGGHLHDVFYKYEIREFIFEAQILSALAIVVPLCVYDWLVLLKRRSRLVPRAPSIGVGSSDRVVLIFSLTLIALGWGVRFGGGNFDSLGTLNGFVTMGPNMAIFILTSRWIAPKPPSLPKWSRWLALAVMGFDALYFTMFSNMRNLIIWPIVAYGLPFILRKAVTARRLAVGAMFLLCFVLAFKTIGEVRGQIFGTQRLSQMVQQSPLVVSDTLGDEEDDQDRWGFVSLLARLSTFNQLSQVVRIAHEEGYYDGETLEYLMYVFIPRVVWPEKPRIVPGQWFAEKIGRGWRWEEANYSNAVNMTIPGELYLNYGWLGTVGGLALLGFLYFAFWESAGFYSEEYNPLGRAFAYVLLAQALFSGSHIGGMVNLVLWYLSCLAVSVALSAFLKRARAARARAEARKTTSTGLAARSDGLRPTPR